VKGHAPLLLFALALFLPSCERGRPPTVVGLAIALDPSVAAFFQASLDASHRDGWPVIRLTPAPDTPVVAPRPGDGALVGAVDAAVRFIGLAGLAAVIGPAGSGEALVAAPIYQEAGIPHLLPTANAPELDRFGRWTFRLAPDLVEEARFMADRVERVYGSRTVTVFYAPDEWGIPLQDAVSAALRSRGVGVVDRLPVPPLACEGDRRVDQLVAASLRRRVPEAAILALRAPEVACVARALHARSPRIRLLAGDGTTPSALLRRSAGPAAGALEVVAFWDPADTNQAARAFVDAFRHATGREPRPDEALAYDAVLAAVTAIRAVGPDPSAVRDHLASLGRDRPPLAGVTGPVRFGDRPPGRFVVRALTGAPVARTDP
jgi:branched-chain amino acid transport system substrate-binding protein